MEEEHQYLDNRIHGCQRKLKNTQRDLSCNYGLRENPKKKTQESPESMKKIQFRCEECGKVFRYEKCLWNHQAGMHSPTNQNQNQNQSERVYELEEPMKSLCISFSLVKKKKRSRVIRYKKTPLSCSFTTFLESRSVSAGYDEELEVAECLILLSKSSPKFDGLKLVGEAMDANPETPKGCLSYKKPRKDGEFDSGFFSNEQKLIEERSSSYETPKEKARFLGDMECCDSDAECDKRNSEHQCKLCNKIFSSYQALGGHQTYHRSGKIRNKRNCREESVEEEPETVTVTREKKRHECSICSRSFDSVQALGGHKKSHGKRQHSKTEDGDDEDLEFLSVVPVTLEDEFY